MQLGCGAIPEHLCRMKTDFDKKIVDFFLLFSRNRNVTK